MVKDRLPTKDTVFKIVTRLKKQDFERNFTSKKPVFLPSVNPFKIINQAKGFCYTYRQFFHNFIDKSLALKFISRYLLFLIFFPFIPAAPYLFTAFGPGTYYKKHRRIARWKCHGQIIETECNFYG